VSVHVHLGRAACAEPVRRQASSVAEVSTQGHGAECSAELSAVVAKDQCGGRASEETSCREVSVEGAQGARRPVEGRRLGKWHDHHVRRPDESPGKLGEPAPVLPANAPGR
jgi:hypothetical protein